MRYAPFDRGTDKADVIKQMYITAYNELMRRSGTIVEDCEIMRATILDFTDLEKKLTAVDEKMEETATLVSVCVRENAATVQAQDAYQEKYDRLTKRFEEEKNERKKLLDEMEARKARATELDKYIKALKESGLTLDQWDDELWFVLVEKGVVQPDGSIVFTFKDGTEIKTLLLT